jgi:chitinase
MVAPYLDMGSDQPAKLYRAVSKAKLRYFSAGFVIGDGCTPTWDDNVALASDPAVNHVITKARSLGARVVVSFGGQSGKDLARSCDDSTSRLAAYDAVIRQLEPTYVDFDIEGDALSEPGSIKARFAVIHRLEVQFPRLVVSVTVPVEPHGLDAQGRSLFRHAKADRARIDLVNIMAMDYGGGSRDMGSAAISAAKSTLRELRRIWPGWTYAKLGITPMIGINDNVHETFTLAEAGQVASFARGHHVGRLAFWALGRDGHCVHAHQTPQDNCSGIAQSPLAFTRAFLGR